MSRKSLTPSLPAGVRQMPSPTRLALQGLDLGHDGMFIRGLGLILVEHHVCLPSAVFSLIQQHA